MAKKKNKGPPYNDDPGVKYVVIDHPWPGTGRQAGKSRDAWFWNSVWAWMHFMLGKKYGLEFIYAMDTREEIIVQLDEEVDITPILGAHHWRKFLKNAAHSPDISYIFEYNYRDCGEPGNHNWMPHQATVSQEPPPHFGFPVLFPYPPPSWAAPTRNVTKFNLALPLPPTRVQTPPPLPDLFEPYDPPAHYPTHDSDVKNVQNDKLNDLQTGEHDIKPKKDMNAAAEVPLYTEKRDPYEEDDAAMLFLKSEPTDYVINPHVKEEKVEVTIKKEQYSPEEYHPSAAFAAAVAKLQRRSAQAQNNDTVTAEVIQPTSPSQRPPSPIIRVKPEPEDIPLPPQSQPAITIHTVVKPEPEEGRLPDATLMKRRTPEEGGRETVKKMKKEFSM